MLSLKNKKICIVDDHHATCDSLRFLFHSVLNVEVEIYNKASVFLDKFSSEWEGCLIIDYFMPLLNGIEVIKTLKKRNNNMGIIVISGLCTKSMIENILSAGAQAFMAKPLKIDVFLKQVKTILSPYSPEN